MIPNRFATEYPERCLQLLDAFEQIASDHDLLGTFSVMMASAILIVPWERAKERHFLRAERGSNLQDALKRLGKSKWLNADFWDGVPPGEWRFSRIVGDPNNGSDWMDEKGNRSFSDEGNTINRRTVDDVFRVLRNALAHGNIVYLDGHGYEIGESRVEHIAFLSRYEEAREQRARTETYRLVTVREAEFLPFVRAWANWVSQHHIPDEERWVA